MKRAADRPIEPRSRKTTILNSADGRWQLEFTGDDPGVLIDWRERELASGPYELSFRMRCGEPGEGELFYTVDEKTNPQRGTRLALKIQGDSDEWQELKFELPTDGRIYQLRIDPSERPGKVTIEALTLRDNDGRTAAAW